MEALCKSCLFNIFFKLLFGTVEQKLTCKAISQDEASVSISRIYFPECWAVLLSNGRGLGRSLSYVGRSQISPSAMLRAALVHKLPCEAIS